MTLEIADAPWAVIGSGRMGSALCALAPQIDVRVAVAWSRSAPPSVAASQQLSGPVENLADVLRGCAVFITVSDGAIGEVARTLAPHLNEAVCVVHCSGSLSSDVLRRAGITAPVASVHPLLAIADAATAVERMPSTAWTVEGSPTAVAWAQQWLGKIGVVPAQIRAENKVLYHAAAVTSAGLVVGLLDAAFQIAEAANIPPEQARAMLVPLALSSVSNLRTAPPKDALTGPVARGDARVVDDHREAIAALGDENLTAIYEILTARTRRLANPSED